MSDISPTAYLLTLDPSVRQRAAQAFATDNSGRHGGTLLDAGNVLGRRSQVIQDIINKNPLIGDTLNEQGQFDIPWHDRIFAGVNDDDIAKALAHRAQRARKATQLGQDATRYGVAYDTLTPDAILRKKVDSAKKYERDSEALRGSILSQEGGAKALAGLSEKPSIEALSGALTQLQKSNRIAEETRLDERPGGAIDRQNMLVRQQQFQEFTADENRRQRAHELQMARIEKSQDRKDRKEQFALQMQQNNLDRAYMRERDERADARADRDKRTAMLMQLVKGLSQLGYGMSI